MERAEAIRKLEAEIKEIENGPETEEFLGMVAYPKTALPHYRAALKQYKEMTDEQWGND